MLDQVKYFSFNKQSDWEKGLLINLQNTPQGLSLSQEGATAFTDQFLPGR